jgi:hypothetical protein
MRIKGDLAPAFRFTWRIHESRWDELREVRSLKQLRGFACCARPMAQFGK